MFRQSTETIGSLTENLRNNSGDIIPCIDGIAKLSSGKFAAGTFPFMYGLFFNSVVHMNLNRNFEWSKRRFDIRVRACRFKMGEQVWFNSPRKYRYLSPKWTLQTTGPYDIIRKVNNVNYVIRQPGTWRSLTVQVNRMRSYRLPVSDVTGGTAQHTLHRRSQARAEGLFVCLLLNGTSALFRSLVPRIVEVEHTNHVINDLK